MHNKLFIDIEYKKKNLKYFSPSANDSLDLSNQRLRMIKLDLDLKSQVTFRFFLWKMKWSLCATVELIWHAE